jgi:preprotein translocase subunit SecE
MGKIRNIITGFRTFFDEVQVEMKKCSWPTKAELMESTVMVLVASVILGSFVGICDFGLLKLLGAILS